MNYKEIFEKLKNKETLTKDESQILQKSILDGNLNKEEIKEIFRVYKKRQISIEEYLGVIDAVKESMLKIDTKIESIDTAGTGGDDLTTFNISTATAFVLAASGIPVAKHGNRSASSKCGSADVLEELGVKIDMDSKKAKESLEKIGITFLFAPIYHPSFKNVVEARKEFGEKTYFNFVGPVVNPANTKYQIIGVSDKTFIDLMGNSLIKSGSKKIWILHDPKFKMDEINPISKTEVYEFEAGKPVNKFIIDPAETGLQFGKIEDLKGGIPEVNSAIMRNVLRGKSNPTQKAAVILNTAAGLTVFGKVDNFNKGVEMAKEVIESGKAFEKLEELIKISNS